MFTVCERRYNSRYSMYKSRDIEHNCINGVFLQLVTTGVFYGIALVCSTGKCACISLSSECTVAFI